MIHLQAPSLSAEIQDALRRLQSELDAISEFEERVTEAKRLWPLRNHSGSPIFGEVRKALASMCSGHRRCCYCEDSCADEIEHIFPKDLYPERVFVWENYLYACGICNVEKRNDFAVFSQATGPNYVDVKRKHGTPVIPPIVGEPVLVDPRVEDPFWFLILDISGTFEYIPLDDLDDRQAQRASYTCESLKLNGRDYLVKGRRSAFGACRGILAEYVNLKAAGADEQALRHRIADIQGQPHATVWQEMKRWFRNGDLAKIPGLETLDASFKAAPEALTW